MYLSTSEAQIAIIIVMSLIGSVIVFFQPLICDRDIPYNGARKLLSWGILCLIVHYIAQQILQRNGGQIAETRTLLNLLFGFPVTYFFNISLVYLQRKGNIPFMVWTAIPTIYVVAILCLLMLGDTYRTPAGTLVSLIVTAGFFFVSLLLSAAYIYNGFRKNRASLQKANPKVRLFAKWIYGSAGFWLIVSLGIPIMAFHGNLLMRTLYGIVILIFCFFYISNFMGYGMFLKSSAASSTLATTTQDTAYKTDKPASMTIPNGYTLSSVINKFVKEEVYCTQGITLRKAADWMGISPNTLRNKLAETEYGKFNNWILYLRINKAKELLLEHPELKCSEISDRCGFCDRQYFQRQFSNIEGTTPTKWLKQRQKEEEKFIQPMRPVKA